MTHVNETFANQSRMSTLNDTTMTRQSVGGVSSVSGVSPVTVSSRDEMVAVDALTPAAVTSDMCLDGCKVGAGWGGGMG